jgi:hypothetical protein
LNTLSESGNVREEIVDLKAKLEKVTTMIGDLSKKTDSSEPLGDLVERELAQMDKAIEEAGAKIAVGFIFLPPASLKIMNIYFFLSRKCCHNLVLLIRALNWR